MKRSLLESYLGKKVTITDSDDDQCTGILKKSGSEEYKNYPNLYIPKNYYFVVSDGAPSWLFKCSCVKKLSESKTLYDLLGDNK